MEKTLNESIAKLIDDAVADASKAHIDQAVGDDVKMLIKPSIQTIASSAGNVLLRELMMAAFIAMFPDPSTALGGRLLGFKNLIETEGSNHFETPDEILEELQQALNLAEMNNEGSKSESALKVWVLPFD
jgi:hypothetical protein